jgi:hypothetical protein
LRADDNLIALLEMRHHPNRYRLRNVLEPDASALCGGGLIHRQPAAAIGHIDDGKIAAQPCEFELAAKAGLLRRIDGISVMGTSV